MSLNTFARILISFFLLCAGIAGAIGYHAGTIRPEELWSTLVVGILGAVIGFFVTSEDY